MSSVIVLYIYVVERGVCLGMGTTNGANEDAERPTVCYLLWREC